MLRSGLFVDKNGGEHVIHEVKEKNYYRIDICKPGAKFQVEPDLVEFSMLRRRKTYQFGNPELYDDLKDVKNTLLHAKLESEEVRGWEEGKFVSKQTRGTDSKFFSSTKQMAGKIQEETYVDGERLLTLLLIQYETTLDMSPMNIADYDTVELEAQASVGLSPYIPYSILKTRFDLSWLKAKNFKVLKTEAGVMEYLELLKALPPMQMIGVDTETTGLDFNLYGEDKIVGIVIGHTHDDVVYIPFFHNKFDNVDIALLEVIVKVLRTKICVAYNKKFDGKVFFKHGVPLYLQHDGYQLAVLNNPVVTRGSHTLKTKEHQRSGNRYLELSDIFGNNEIHFQDLDEETVRVYACPDAGNTIAVWEDEWSKLPKETREVYKLECELADVKMEQEYWGFRVNEELFLDKYDVCLNTIDLLTKMIFAVTRREFNIGSNNELRDLLYRDMKCPVDVRTKTGYPSTSAAALKKLKQKQKEEPSIIVTDNILDKKGNLIVTAKSLNEAQYPIVVLLEKYREQVKLATAFYERIKKGKKGSRYFSWVNQNGAASGRQSSPMHQLPKPIREIILPDSSEHDIYDTDYGQIELRVIFWLSGQKNMVEMCKDPDIDIHRAIGSGISGKEVWEISSEERSKGKPRNFGVVYLISEFGLAGQMFGANPTKEQVAFAKESIDDFYRANKRVAEYIRKNREKIETKGKISTFFDRYRYFTEIFDPDLPNDRKASLIRQGNNTPVQGTAADIMKFAEINLNRWIKNKGWDKLVETPEGDFPLVRVALSVHDEVILMAHKSIPPEEILEMKRECMELDIEDAPPFFVDTAIVTNWAEGKADKYAIPYQLRDAMIDTYRKTGVSEIKDMQNLRDEMLHIIDNYRDESLIGYMEELLTEHVTVQGVADHVRHPSYTHDLISRFPQSKEDENKNGKMTHLESISHAVEKYFEVREDLLQGRDLKEDSKEKDDKQIDEDIRDTYLEEIGEIGEALTFVDNHGQVHYMYESEAEEDRQGAYMTFEDIDFIERTTSGDIIRYWELFDTIIIDTECLNKVECNELLRIVYEYNDPEGFSNVKLMRGGDGLLETGIRVENFDPVRIKEYLKSKEKMTREERVM